MARILRKFALQFVLLALLLGSVGAYAFIEGSMSAAEKELDARISELESEKESLSVEAQSNVSDIVEDATGLDSTRKLEDDRVAQALFKEVFSWDSYAAYNKSRANAIEKYGLDADGQFLTEVMPEIDTYVIGGYKGSESEDTTERNLIDDDGLNMSYKSMTSYVTGISDDGTYSYFTEATVVSSDDHDASSTVTMVMTYDVNDGKVSNLRAYTPMTTF